MPKLEISEDKKRKEQEAILREILEDCPVKTAPYTAKQLKEIRRCLHIDTEKELKRDDIALMNLRIDRIMQDAVIYQERLELDGPKESDPLQEVVKHEKSLWPKAGEMRGVFRKIQKHVEDLSVQIGRYDNLPFGQSLFLTCSQREALEALKEAVKILKTYPLPQPKGTTGAMKYPALNSFVNKLRVIYEQETGKRSSLSTNNTGGEPELENMYGDPDVDEPKYHYTGPFFKFLCACVLPLTTTHKTPKKIGDFASKLV